MSERPGKELGGRGYVLAAAALVVGVALGLMLPTILPGAQRDLLPGSCTHVRNELRQIKVDATETQDAERVADAVKLLQARPDCFGDHEGEDLEGLRYFLERNLNDGS